MAELGSSTGETGEIETSDPVELTVLAPGPNPDQDHIAPVISVGVTGPSVLISLLTASAQQYAIEYRTNLVAGDWQPLQTIVGDGSVKTITDSVTNDNSRFYRAVLKP